MTGHPPRDDDDWSDFTTAWTAPTGEPEAAAPASVTALSVRRRALLARLNFYLEIAGAFVAAGLLARLSLLERIPLPTAVAGVLFCAFAVGMTLWARDRSPDDAETPREALLQALDQARSGRRWAIAGLAITLMGLLFLGVMATTFGDPRPSTGFIYGGMVLFLALSAAFYVRHARRSRNRRDAYQTALAELQEADSVSASSASEAMPPDAVSPPPMA